MSIFQEIYRGIYGAAILARFDKRGMEVFDISADGFWRSFIAVIVTIPLYVAMLLMPAVGGEDSTLRGQIGVDIAAMLLTWLAVLLAMMVLTRLVKCAEKYVAFVIAYNWSNIIVTGIMVAAGAVSSVLAGTVFEPGLLLLAALYVIVYNWFVIRESLGIDTILAILLLIVAMIVELLVDYGVGAVAGLEAVPA